jgi:hypothetical protein
MLLEGNRPKYNFYTVKSMMKPLGLGYQKIDKCPNFYMLYYVEYANFIKCKLVNMLGINLIVVEKGYLSHTKTRDTFLLLLGYKCYLCIQRLSSI